MRTRRAWWLIAIALAGTNYVSAAQTSSPNVQQNPDKSAPISESSSQPSCNQEKIKNPICPVKAGSKAQDAAKSAAACARTQAQGDAKKLAKIAAETAQQIGAGKKEASLILSAIGDALKLNAADRNQLANDAADSMCSTVCVVVNPSTPSYVCPPLEKGVNAFDAAQAAAQCSTKHKEQAAQIAAETAVQIAANPPDQALIIAAIMEALKFDAKQKNQFIRSVEGINCIAMPADLNALNPGAGNEGNPAGGGPSGGGGFDNPAIINDPPVSPN